MKKLIFFFLISYIITQTINDYQTKPYYDFDWTDEDSYDFELTFTQSVPNDVKIVLANGTKKCTPNCTPSEKKVSCTLVSTECEADKDNPGYKFYYAVYYRLTQGDITKTGDNGYSAGVTISVCSGYYIKYSLALLSLILF